ncbi:rhombosortase [Rheinheimera sp.]|uniref:rhombosortase n=1 Tax=Rheinheimera sp. TaxID=1869214 RepID=UPI00307CE443
MPLLYRPLFCLLFIALLCLLLQLFPAQVTDWLNYQRAEPLQLWRFWTAHLLHSNAWHLAMNLGGLAVIFYLHQMHYQRKQLLQFLLLSAALLSAALYLFSPDIQIYVGLSGVLHALLAFGAVRDLQQRWYSGGLILLGLAAKVGYEQFYGPDPALGALIDARVAIDAHAYGLVIGVALALCLPNYGLTDAVNAEKKSGSA